MNIQLINPPNPKFSTIEQILYNRGIAEEDIKHYLNLRESDINAPEGLGEKALRDAVAAISKAVKNNSQALVIVDCDCDGYTSAALLINYLHIIFPTWVENNLEWIMHDGKQHGLNDHMNKILSGNYSLVIVPDGGSNDFECHKILYENNIQCIILDHHLVDIPKDYPYAIIINNNANYI